LTIAPLKEDIIREYINKWFNEESQANKFIEIVVGNDRLLELSKRSIFILGLACMVYGKNNEIRANLSYIYKSAIDYLLESRNPKGTLIYTVKHEVLKELAFRFLQMQEKRFNKYLAESIITKIVSSKGQLYEKPEEFLSAIIRETHLLQQTKDDYEFIHLTFQEYLAAQALFDEENSTEKLLEYCNVNMWEEVFKFYTELLSDDKRKIFITEISKRNLSLALRVSAVCLDNEIMSNIICNTSKDAKLRMLKELDISLATLNEEKRREIILDTIEHLFKHENNSAILYFAIQLLKKYDPDDERKIMYNNFNRHQMQKLKELLSNEDYKFTLLDIPEGEFIMGNDNSIEQNEKPAHKVNINSFQIAKYPLTNKAYEFIMNYIPTRRNEYSKEDSQPAINIDWFDAYICALKIGCRLPSEAEWEYACRAGTTSEWWFGDDEKQIINYACCYETTAKATRNLELGSANEWGLVDVHGNVWEWCNDWFSEYSSEQQNNPQGPLQGDIKVRRGGGWGYHARGCQSAFRFGNEPYYKYKDIGVRFAK
jgi:formylglycine-generating enzyme required for sulfatase activity